MKLTLTTCLKIKLCTNCSLTDIWVACGVMVIVEGNVHDRRNLNSGWGCLHFT